MSTTFNPIGKCDYSEWSDSCVNDLKKNLYSYFSYKYSKNVVDCAINKMKITEIYKNPYELNDKLYVFLKNIKPLLDKCNYENSNKNSKISLTLSFITIFIIIFVYFIFCYMNKNKKSLKKL
jgi:hypothetical protein